MFIANGNTAFYHDLVNGVYQPRIDDGSQLNYNNSNDTYTLIDTQGDRIVLNGFGSSWLPAQQGQFQSFTDPGGQTMAATSYTSDGHVAEEQRSATSNGNTTIESWLFSYLPSTDPNAGLLQSVTERTQVNGDGEKGVLLARLGVVLDGGGRQSIDEGGVRQQRSERGVSAP